MFPLRNMDAKRLFDLMFSALGLLVLSPLFLIISLYILFDSGKPIIYRQKRVGKNWEPFILYKFRTMDFKKETDGSGCTTNNDKRITRLGRFLRKYKLDEIPQLYNVLKGDMSFVGPRPELPEFVEHYSEFYREILKIKPGITDIASIKFRHESSLLGDVNDIEMLYLTTILPRKLEYNREYIAKRGFFYDIGLIFKTIYTVIFK